MNQDLEQQPDSHFDDDKREDVVLNLTLAGARECILDLLEQMDSVEGFYVLDGSFVVNSSDSYIS